MGILASIPLFEAHAASNTRVVATSGIGIYSDSACTQTLTLLNWGTVTPGSIVNRIIYIKNVGNRQLKLGMSTNNWNPTTTIGAIMLSWNQEGTIFNSGQVVAATLTLKVSSTASGFTAFSVDVMIRGTNYGRQG